MANEIFFFLFIFFRAVYKKLFNYVPQPTSFLLLYFIFFLHEYSFLFRFPLATTQSSIKIHRIIFLWCDCQISQFCSNFLFCFSFSSFSHSFTLYVHSRKKKKKFWWAVRERLSTTEEARRKNWGKKCT